MSPDRDARRAAARSALADWCRILRSPHTGFGSCAAAEVQVRLMDLRDADRAEALALDAKWSNLWTRFHLRKDVSCPRLPPSPPSASPR
jgi:hypothetical protein